MTNKRNILVTGGAGFIGSHLVERLLAEDAWRVVVVDDFNDFYAPALKRANVAPHVGRDDYELVEADIRDRA
ncbi:MAG TPA: GDP-mannose 4,6-dehydratase, partial [Pyrinomonadaceae bacterium]